MPVDSDHLTSPMDAKTFERFEQLLDDIMPTCSEDDLVTVDEVIELLCHVRQWCEHERLPHTDRRRCVDLIVGPFLSLQGLTSVERVQMKQRLSDAMGFDVLPS